MVKGRKGQDMKVIYRGIERGERNKGEGDPTFNGAPIHHHVL